MPTGGERVHHIPRRGRPHPGRSRHHRRTRRGTRTGPGPGPHRRCRGQSGRRRGRRRVLPRARADRPARPHRPGLGLRRDGHRCKPGRRRPGRLPRGGAGHRVRPRLRRLRRASGTAPPCPRCSCGRRGSRRPPGRCTGCVSGTRRTARSARPGDLPRRGRSRTAVGIGDELVDRDRDAGGELTHDALLARLVRRTRQPRCRRG